MAPPPKADVADQHPTLRRRPIRWPLFALALIAAAVSLLLGSSLTGRTRLGFRDAGHFYTPLYGYVAARERAEWLPLYNPIDQTGMPLAGETTTAVFYPVRRIVYRLIPTPETALAWYIALHLGIASCSIGYAAKIAGASRGGVALAMVAYPLSGPIWFLYTNPPFLVGAAWSPLALAGGFGLLKHARRRDFLITTIGLAMPVLGGDPQSSIHVVLIGVVVGCIAVVGMAVQRRNARSVLATSSGAFLRLATALLFAICLAAPQIAASSDWALQSVRYGASAIRGEAPREVEDFSVAPWHWLEAVTPYLSGRLFPTYTRISHAVTGDGRTWALTLYIGLVPLALAMIRYRHLIRFLLTRPLTRPLTNKRLMARYDGWDLVWPIALVMSMGGFGLGSFLSLIAPNSLSEWRFAADSPYRLLVAFLPGYSGFRYPAKWLIFVPMGLGIAAARQTGHFSPLIRRATSRLANPLAALGLGMAALVVVVLHRAADSRPNAVRLSDPIWGPLDTQAAGIIVATSALLVVAVAATFWRLAARRMNHDVAIACLLVLVTVDLGLVAWPAVAKVDSKTESRLLAKYPSETNVAFRAMRFSGGGWPVERHGCQPKTVPADSLRSDADIIDRMMVAESSMRSTLFGRWHLEHQVAVVNSVTTLSPHRTRSFWQAANQRSVKLGAAEQSEFWETLMNWLAIDRAWASVAAGPILSLVDSPSIDRSAIAAVPSSDTSSSAAPSSAVVWYSDWRAIKPRREVSADLFGQRIDQITNDPNRRNVPWIETATTAFPGALVASAIPRTLTAKQTLPGQWEIIVDAPSPGMVCVKQFQDGNFRAARQRLPSDVEDQKSEVSTTDNAATTVPTDVYRCDFLFSAVPVPTGKYKILITYAPRWWLPSASVAAIAWLVFAWLVAACLWRSAVSGRINSPNSPT